MSNRITSRAEATRSAELMPIGSRFVVAVRVSAVPWDISRVSQTEYRATTSWEWQPIEGYLSDVLTRIGLFDGPGERL